MERNNNYCVMILLLQFLISCSLIAQAGGYDWENGTVLFPGVRHAVIRVEAAPRPMDIQCMRIDTEIPGLRFHTTGRVEDWTADERETMTQRTRDFMREVRDKGMKMVVAINAAPWSPVMQVPYPANLSGLAISEGVLVSPGDGRASLIIHQDGAASMASTASSFPMEDVHTAVSGFGFCLQNGAPPTGSGGDIHPRTGTGLCVASRYVFFLVIDGRRHASHGATVDELGNWLHYFGAHTGINMDGGGSTTMARWDPETTGDAQAVLMNNATGFNWLNADPEFEEMYYSPSERHNGNNLGVIVPHLDFRRHPTSAVLAEGDSHRFEVEIFDAWGPVQYQWEKDGAPIPNAPNMPWLDISTATVGDSGQYRCRVSDDYMTLVSQNGHLLVEQAMPLKTGAFLALAVVALCILLRVRPHGRPFRAQALMRRLPPP